jgi:hypothetical protein
MYNVVNIFLPNYFYQKTIVEVLHSCDHDDEHNVNSFEKHQLQENIKISYNIIKQHT